MIKALTVTNHLGDSIKLVLTEPALSGFIVKSIEGLGQVKANVNMTNLAMYDGSRYNSAYLQRRDIIINLGFLQSAKESIEDVRHKSYKFFPTKKKVQLLIETDRRTLKTEGIVEANEPDIFSSEEGCAITISCPDPYLYSVKENEYMFSGVQAMFEFPFENESLTEPLLEMGVLINNTEKMVFYEGDADVGIKIFIHAIGEASGLSIYNVTTKEQMTIDSNKLIELTGSDIIEGDSITIETTRGYKSITLLRNGTYTNILNCLAKDSDWFTLCQGDNIFAYRADAGSTNLQFRITNKIVYSGV